MKDLFVLLGCAAAVFIVTTKANGWDEPVVDYWGDQVVDRWGDPVTSSLTGHLYSGDSIVPLSTGEPIYTDDGIIPLPLNAPLYNPYSIIPIN